MCSAVTEGAEIQQDFAAWYVEFLTRSARPSTNQRKVTYS